MEMQVAFVLASFILFCKNCYGYLEKVSISGCESCTLRLTCRHLDSIIAILDVQFTPNENYSLSVIPIFGGIPIQPRAALNQRCSGVNHCSFVLTKDCPGASTLGLGNLTINYFCVAAPKLTKHCNKEITLPSLTNQRILEGFVHNPGYPRFYVGKEICHWKIKALPWQKIKVTIFDISLLGSVSENCTDVFQIRDSEYTIFSSCLQEELPITLLSVDNCLEISLTPSSKETLVPRRGVLFYYTTIGCPTPSSPKNAYFVGRNESIAEFCCEVDYAFPDTHLRTRYIKCIDNQWDENLPLPNCDNITIVQAQTINLIASDLKTTKGTMTEKMSIQEIVIPTVIIILLLVLNTVVLFVIYKYKKRKETEFSEEELGALPINCDKTNPKA